MGKILAIQNVEACVDSLLGWVSLSAPRIEPLCTICTDVISDFDEWLVVEPTEDQIVTYAKELCKALGMILEDLEMSCNEIMDRELPDIIEGLFNDNLDANKICTQIKACP